MNMSRVTQAFAVAAIALGSLGFANGASAATISVTIDCKGTGGIPSWSVTSDWISVQVYIFNQWYTLKGGGPVTDCTNTKYYYDTFATVDADDVSAVRVLTNGTNTFWIDELKLNSSIVRQWGVDNSIGFCISEDPNDGNQPECHHGVASDPYLFPQYW